MCYFSLTECHKFFNKHHKFFNKHHNFFNKNHNFLTDCYVICIFQPINNHYIETTDYITILHPMHPINPISLHSCTTNLYLYKRNPTHLSNSHYHNAATARNKLRRERNYTSVFKAWSAKMFL